MAGQAHGFDNTVVIGTEATYGTPASNFQWAGIVDSFEPEENKNVDQRRSIGIRAPIMLREGTSEVDGKLSVALQNARLIAYALGKVGTTGDETAGYTHTITPIRAGEELVGVTVQNHNNLLNFTRNYVGGKVDKLTLTASAEEAVTLEAEFQFSHVETDVETPAVVSAELDNYYMFYEGTVKINDNPVADVTEFEVEINNNLERRFTLNGQNRPARIEEGALEISGSLTIDFTSIDHYNSFLAGDSVTVTLTLQDVANPNRSIVVTLLGGLYDKNTLSVGAEDLQEQELEAVFTDMQVVVKDQSATLI